jgi:hypothetical protein
MAKETVYEITSEETYERTKFSARTPDGEKMVCELRASAEFSREDMARLMKTGKSVEDVQTKIDAGADLTSEETKRFEKMIDEIIVGAVADNRGTELVQWLPFIPKVNLVQLFNRASGLGALATEAETDTEPTPNASESGSESS